jgi:hypothetical protein
MEAVQCAPRCSAISVGVTPVTHSGPELVYFNMCVVFSGSVTFNQTTFTQTVGRAADKFQSDECPTSFFEMANTEWRYPTIPIGSMQTSLGHSPVAVAKQLPDFSLHAVGIE